MTPQKKPFPKLPMIEPETGVLPSGSIVVPAFGQYRFKTASGGFLWMPLPQAGWEEAEVVYWHRTDPWNVPCVRYVGGVREAFVTARPFLRVLVRGDHPLLGIYSVPKNPFAAYNRNAAPPIGTLPAGGPRRLALAAASRLLGLPAKRGKPRH